MNFFLLLVLLLLFACSTTSLRDMEDELVVCLEGGYLCADLQEEIEKKELRQIEKERWAALTTCPEGYVFYCRDSWCSQHRLGRKMPSQIEMFGSGCVRVDHLGGELWW